MNAYQTEEEQVEQLKKWWKENGKSVLGGALIGVAVLYGGKVWLDQRNNHAELASAEFEAMVQDINQDKKEQAADRGALVLGQYSDTAYADLAALAMAKIKVEEKDLGAAKSHLRYALDNAGQEQIKHIARLRLARVFIAEANYDEALKLVNGVDVGKYEASYEEVKGDAFVAKGEIEQAKTAYNMALQSLDPSARSRRYIEMKLDDLGQSPSVTEAS